MTFATTAPGHGAVRAHGRPTRAALDAHRPQRHPHRSGHLPLPAARRRRKERITFDFGFHDSTLNTADSVPATVVHFTTTVKKQMPGTMPGGNPEYPHPLRGGFPSVVMIKLAPWTESTVLRGHWD